MLLGRLKSGIELRNSSNSPIWKEITAAVICVGVGTIHFQLMCRYLDIYIIA